MCPPAAAEEEAAAAAEGAGLEAAGDAAGLAALLKGLENALRRFLDDDGLGLSLWSRTEAMVAAAESETARSGGGGRLRAEDLKLKLDVLLLAARLSLYMAALEQRRTGWTGQNEGTRGGREENGKRRRVNARQAT